MNIVYNTRKGFFFYLYATTTMQNTVARNTKILDHDRVDFKMPYLSKFIIEHKLIWIIRLIHKEPTWSKI